MNHDHSYKLLFTHPEMVADLLRGFVREDWVAELDFSTLEKAGGSYVSDDLREREDDIIWRVRWKNVQGKDQNSAWLYVYLLIEFQSSVDWFMAVRIMTYVGLLYQDLVRKVKQLKQMNHCHPCCQSFCITATRAGGPRQTLRT